MASTVIAAVLVTGCGAQTRTTSTDPSSIPAATSSPEASTKATPSAQAAPSETPAAVTTATLLMVQNPGLRIRSEPATDAGLIRSLPQGAIVSVTSGPIEAEGHDWYEVRHGEVSGWVASGEQHDWLAVIRNGRIGFACIRCNDDGSSALMTVEADGSDPRIIKDAFAFPLWAPDGSQLAISVQPNYGDAFGLEVLAADGTLVEGLGEGYQPAWSPDGTRLAFINPADRAIELLLDGEQIGVVVTDHGAPISLHWSPDGQRLAFTAVDCPDCPIGEPIAGDPPMSVFAFEPPGGAVIKLADGGNAGILHWSADGSMITFLERNLSTGKLEVRDVNVDSGAVTVGRTIDSGFGYAVSPDESRLAIGTPEGIVVADLNNSVVVAPYDRASTLMPQHPRWSPDGQWILYDIVATQGDARYPAVVRADGSEGRQLVEHDGYEAAWQPVLEALP